MAIYAGCLVSGWRVSVWECGRVGGGRRTREDVRGGGGGLVGTTGDKTTIGFGHGALPLYPCPSANAPPHCAPSPRVPQPAAHIGSTHFRPFRKISRDPSSSLTEPHRQRSASTPAPGAHHAAFSRRSSSAASCRRTPT